MQISSPYERRWSAGPFVGSDLYRLAPARGRHTSQPTAHDSPADEDLQRSHPLVAMAMRHVPGISLEKAGKLRFYPHPEAVVAFYRSVESLQSPWQGDERQLLRRRVLGEVLARSLQSTDFYQAVLDEIRSREPGCSDHFEVMVNDLERLLRLGTVESTEKAAVTMLRQVCLKRAQAGGSESVTAYALLGQAVDEELRRRFPASQAVFQAVAYPEVGGISRAQALGAARSFLDDEADRHFEHTRLEAAEWPAWVAYAGQLPQVRARTTSLYQAAEKERLALADDEQAQYALLIERDLRISRACTEPIVAVLKAMQGSTRPAPDACR